MIPDSFVLEKIWLAVATHLWQTTLVVLPLFLLARVLRNAPARLSNMLWTIGLVKVFLPLAALEWLTGDTILPVLRRLVPSLFGPVAAAWLGRASAVLDPGILAVQSPSQRSDIAGIILIALSAAWVAGMGLIAVRSARLSRRQGLGASEAAEARSPAAHAKVRKALGGTRIPMEAVRVVSGLAMPAVKGLLHPKIIVPEVMISRLSAGELRAVLLHEDEHRRRLDPLRALPERAALWVFYFYPLVWSLVRRLRSSCEMACDEAALRAGIDSADYARALARSLRLGLLPSGSALANAPEGSSGISRRFMRIQDSGRYVTMTRHRLAILAAVLMVTLVSLIPLPPLSGTERISDEDPAPDADAPAPPPTSQAGEDVTPPKMIPETITKPEYPETARKAGIVGDVILNVEVKTDGTVGAVTVERGIPEAPELEASAEDAVRRWRFVPAEENGEPIAITVRIPVAFRLDDKGKANKAGTMPTIIPESAARPAYPEDARKAGISGKVLLTVTVKTDGSAGTIEVAEAIEGYPSLAESAVEAVRQWKFKPATEGGKPVETTVKIPVVFRLDEDKEASQGGKVEG